MEFVRDGLKVWPFCSACGCRLKIIPSHSIHEVVLVHFGNQPDRDARGCVCTKRFEAIFMPRYKVAEFIHA